ncbi:hypothetical protein WJX84_005714 [Apatococcus fuscideae]|uniref:tRNA-specific adenosine deaminase 1 n=1 Tax=Apatococcus fuscideae TaxID=2026836 RepID=A0AAW1TH44_9CHLO
MADIAVSRAVLEMYKSLPKTGKPQAHEHTVLAGILALKQSPDGNGSLYSILSLGTGTKCLGASQRSPQGDTVNDSHAEVIARRAFKRWVYQELEGAMAEPSAPCPSPQWRQRSQIFSRLQTGQWQLLNGVTFHMFISQAPCGDACIYSAVGVLRRKPGRGEATLSMSCSDKMARWGLLGLQGSLLMAFLAEPVYLSSVHIAIRQDTYSKEQAAMTTGLQHAISGRTRCLADRTQSPYRHTQPAIYLVPLDLEQCGLRACAARPVPSGMSELQRGQRDVGPHLQKSVHPFAQQLCWSVIKACLQPLPEFLPLHHALNTARLDLENFYALPRGLIWQRKAILKQQF